MGQPYRTGHLHNKVLAGAALHKMRCIMWARHAEDGCQLRQRPGMGCFRDRHKDILRRGPAGQAVGFPPNQLPHPREGL
jgi:hypothetical protein